MKLTDSKEKMEIVERLVKEGSIDFIEALKLLEEHESIVQWYPQYPWTFPYQPWVTSGEYWAINTADGTITFADGLIGNAETVINN